MNNTGTKEVSIMKQTAFWREKNGEYRACLKYSVPTFVEQIYKMQRLEVSGAVRLIYRSLGVLLNDSVLLTAPSLFVASFCSGWVVLQYINRESFMKALTMLLSMNGLLLLVFPTRPAPDHLPGNLYGYA